MSTKRLMQNTAVRELALKTLTMPRGWREMQKPEKANSHGGKQKISSWRNREWKKDSKLSPHPSSYGDTKETTINETINKTDFAPKVFGDQGAYRSLTNKTESVFSGKNVPSDYPGPVLLEPYSDKPLAEEKPKIMPIVEGASSNTPLVSNCLLQGKATNSKNSSPLSLFPLIGNMPKTTVAMSVVTSPSSSPQWRQLLSKQDTEKIMQAFSLDAPLDIQQLNDEIKRLELEKVQWEKQRSDLLAQQENLEGELDNMALAKDELVQQKDNLQKQLRTKEAYVHELETTLLTAQRALEEYRQKEPCDWVIPRDEIHVMNNCLGVGGWGTVVLGSFRGCKVAVKQIHELILSPHNRRLFEREMNIASRCRHPCLLQFIGATNDEGSPLFVTELMELSLRALLEQRQLTETEIFVISLDVSRALNYLHHMKPSPIVHRDVSSANVLLWRQGEHWRGKVSDYGTAKFVQQTMTVAPGALIYSAPEALSSNQTSKVDVYSFGVLLCEMCIREMPDPERREEQVLLVRNRLFRNLVRQCLQADPAMRPDMAQIIQELEQFDGTDSVVS